MVLTLKYGTVGSSTPGGGRRYSGSGGYDMGDPIHHNATTTLNATGLNYSGIGGGRGQSPPPPFRAAPMSAMRDYSGGNTNSNYNSYVASRSGSAAAYLPPTTTNDYYNDGGFRSSSVTSTGAGMNPDGSKNHLSYRSASPTFMYRAPQPQEVEMVAGNPNILRSEATYGPPSPHSDRGGDIYAQPPPPAGNPPQRSWSDGAGGGGNPPTRWNVEADEDRLPYNDDEPGYDIAPLPPYPNEDTSVVPSGLLPPSEMAATPIDWESHPCSLIILTLLRERGIVLPHHNQIVKYHMASGFLDYLAVVQVGAYFVKYKRANAAPKERFMRIAVDDGTPFLMWTLHDKSFQLIDRVPLAHLVGVNANIKSLAFRRHLVSQNLIKGCHAGQHRPRLPTNGCLTLWFWDSSAKKPRSVDILTTSMATHMLWKKTFEGILSVNSTSVTGSVVDMDDLRMQAEEALMAEDALDTDE